MKRILACVLALCLLCGCAANTASDTTLFAMDTAMTLRLYGDTDGVSAQWLQARINELDGICDATDKSGALTLLNTTGHSDNSDLLSLVQTASDISARTDGALDLSVYPAVRLWGFPTQIYRIPSGAELATVSSYIGMQHVRLSGSELTLDRNTQLDLGAVAKGYAADCCRAYLEQQGLHGVLSLGGNVQTVGEKPFGEPWTIGISNPDDPASYLATVSIQGSKAIVTSGDYQRYFEADGVRYCHIIDPATASPVQGSLRSVTVVADSGVLADGLSTALFVMGMDKAVSLWRASDDFEAIFISSDGTVSVTAGLADSVTDCQFTKIAR